MRWNSEGDFRKDQSTVLTTEDRTPPTQQAVKLGARTKQNIPKNKILMQQQRNNHSDACR
jgi:ATP-dependent helicase/DNAse subunit B